MLFDPVLDSSLDDLVFVLSLILWFSSKINVYYVGKRAGKNPEAHQVGKTRAFFRLDTNS